MNEQNDLLRQETTGLEKKQVIRRNLEELRRRRKEGELLQEGFPLENIYYINDDNYENRPLTRKDLGRQAVVLSAEEFSQIGYIDLLLANGEELTIFADDFCSNPNDPEAILVIFPEDLGDEEVR